MRAGRRQSAASILRHYVESAGTGIFLLGADPTVEISYRTNARRVAYFATVRA